MIQKLAVSAVLGCVFVASAGGGSVLRPWESARAEKPDKTLFDKAMDLMKHGRYQESRTLLEALAGSYSESEYVTRAKLALDDIWYAEGGIGPRQESHWSGGMTFFPPLTAAPEEIRKDINSRTKNL